MWTVVGWQTTFMLKPSLSSHLPHHLFPLAPFCLCFGCTLCLLGLLSLSNLLLPNTPSYNIHPASSYSFSKLSQMVRNLTRQRKKSALITTHQFLFVTQPLLVLSCTVKHSCFLLICSVLCCIYYELHLWYHTFMMPITDLLNDFGWIGCSKMCRCWAMGQCVQKWQMSWCASLLGAYGAWFPEVLKTVDRSSLCFTLLNHASFAIAHFSAYLALISLCCLHQEKWH